MTKRVIIITRVTKLMEQSGLGSDFASSASCKFISSIFLQTSCRSGFFCGLFVFVLVSEARDFYVYTRDYWIVYNFLLIEPIINLTFSLACNLSFKDYSMRMEIFSKLSSILSNCYLRLLEFLFMSVWIFQLVLSRFCWCFGSESYLGVKGPVVGTDEVTGIGSLSDIFLLLVPVNMIKEIRSIFGINILLSIFQYNTCVEHQLNTRLKQYQINFLKIYIDR